MQIDKEDCFREIADDFHSYEDRIWDAGTSWDDSYNEVEKIIKEQMIKVFARKMLGGIEKINNGNFEWS
ncbi:hypothetical protein D3C74_405320 [compost metagenome]